MRERVASADRREAKFREAIETLDDVLDNFGDAPELSSYVREARNMKSEYEAARN